MNDIIVAVGTPATDLLIEGTHQYQGKRYFAGFIYKEKTYGSVIVLDYTGLSRIIFLNNGVISSQTLTTT